MEMQFQGRLKWAQGTMHEMCFFLLFLWKRIGTEQLVSCYVDLLIC